MNYRICFILAALLPWGAMAQGTAEAALDVINHFTHGSMPVKVTLDQKKNALGGDSFCYALADDTLEVHASSAVAACRGFYHWIRSKGAGICSWSGNRFEKPQDMHTTATAMSSPYRDHQYMNVVTYGYTMPYWGRAEWDKELEWMVLHGVDMPLMLIGQEAVYRQVFKDMGLTDQEVDEWLVGPAHLPWMRMGNLSGNSFDGPPPRGWDSHQMVLAEYVMDRMRRLGMKPICPAFGGFVPKALAKHYNVELDTTGWDWMPAQQRNYRIRPDSPLFVEIGARFIEKWEQIFGKGHYYLSDSFNEMAIPQDTALMARYGQAVYSSISQANADAVWVMQGWSLGYQRWLWGNGIFEALLKHVPQEKFYLLDMATDYNCCFWKNSFDWDFYHGFDGREWVWSVIPNMGGKTAYTGVMEYYANGRIEAQTSANRGKLTGYGMAPEGLDNNEMIYELLCDGGYMGATDSINTAEWLKNYTLCRYGKTIPAVDDYWQGLRQSIYSTFHDHPQFGWQVRNNITGRGTVNTDSTFNRAVENIFAHPSEISQWMKMLDNEGARLLEADLIEGAAQYIAGKVERMNGLIASCAEQGDKDGAHRMMKHAEQTLMKLDAILEHHPLHRLERWEQAAQANAQLTEQEKQALARNARRIVSVWYGLHEKDEPVNDYSCRLWSGLVRDYYLPRMKETWLKKIDGKRFDQIEFENHFVELAPKLSEPLRIDDGELMNFVSETIAGLVRY